MQKRPVTKEEVQAFATAADEVIKENYDLHGYTFGDPKPLEITFGRRYAKVIDVSQGRSAWAFVDMATGEILKAASWAAPAKHARGTILAEDHGKSAVSAYGPHYLR